MYVLNAIQTTDNYPADNEVTGRALLKCPGAVRVNIRTTINEVTCSFKLRSGTVEVTGGSAWTQDINIGRSQRSLDRQVEAVRFKSTTPGSAGTVTVEAMTADEVT